MNRTKLEPPRTPSFEEKQFIRVMEQYGKVGVKVDTLCVIVFSKHQTSFLERELRYYKERYFNYKYIGYNPKGRIIKRGEFYYLIDNQHADKEKMQYNAYYNYFCAIEDLRSTIKTYGKIQLKGQTQFDITDDYDMYEIMKSRLESEMEE